MSAAPSDQGSGASDSAAADFPQAGRERLIVPQPISFKGTGLPSTEMAALQRVRDGAVFMMGDNPALPRMPKRPTLLDFFRLRFSDIACRHLLQSARLALNAGQEEKIVMACLLHDISNGALLRTDHGYWSAQLVAPYVSEEIAWAVKYHQALRYFADETVGFKYPDAYVQYFGADYELPEYIRRAHDEARNHPWYMSSRLITLYDVYAFQEGSTLTHKSSPTSSDGTSGNPARDWALTGRLPLTCGEP